MSFYYIFCSLLPHFICSFEQKTTKLILFCVVKHIQYALYVPSSAFVYCNMLLKSSASQINILYKCLGERALFPRTAVPQRMGLSFKTIWIIVKIRGIITFIKSRSPQRLRNHFLFNRSSKLHITLRQRTDL